MIRVQARAELKIRQKIAPDNAKKKKERGRWEDKSQLTEKTKLSQIRRERTGEV